MVSTNLAVTYQLKAPDSWTCEVHASATGSFSPMSWCAPDGRTATVSEGIRQHAFATADDAMMAAYRERLNRDVLRRNTRPAIVRSDTTA